MIEKKNVIQQKSRRALLKDGVTLSGLASLSQLAGLGRAFGQNAATKRLVWISMNGGWDILETIDPKASSNDNLEVTYGFDLTHGLAGSDGSIRMGRWLPKIASCGSDMVVIRGLAMGTTSHDAGRIYMDTGILSNAGMVNVASIPSIVASESQATIPIIQLNGGADPRIDRGLANPVSVVRAQNLRLYRSMYPESSEELASKLKILEYLKKSATSEQAIVGINDRLSAVLNAEDKIRGQFQNSVGAKLQIDDEDRVLFMENAPITLQQSDADVLALALKLINNNLVTCVNLGFGGFDTHSNQESNLQPRLTNFDHLMSVFIAELKKNQQLDDTLIVVYSDFGRTPKVNTRNGRDHWPVGGALLIGGGIQGGRVVGATDDSLRAENINFSTGLPDVEGNQLNPSHLAASVIELTLGNSYLNSRTYLTSVPAMMQVRA